MEIVLQAPAKPGMYVSELIDGRYQICESAFYEGQFYIFDHLKDGGVILRNKKGEFFEMFSDVNAARLFVGAGAVAVKQKKVYGKKTAVAPKAYVKKGRKESALSYMKELLSKSPEMSDSHIADNVKQRFPDSNYNASMVKFNRKKLAA